ncbi:hypothetical protein DL991_10655 [Amycolatopsis sp. WAC 01375]|uniref:hypothetical protein n=1 Tax=Amycolatopsis sp. WAC 01375 TaxID=2203194 RepID=UPI000F794D0B|nr:hypothetical protein [Amycolatopsis sp. WAC 01375]RSM80564.1 hypothetical protein DL991_10655 [Amycolatopsis sp. WAC 01375]
MLTASSYVEVATADDAWTCSMRLLAMSFDSVQTILKNFARNHDWPVNALIVGDADKPVTEIELHRDPSVTHGVPDVPRCWAAVRRLATETGWTASPHNARSMGILVGLGLREGYAPGAPQHEPSEVTSRLATAGTERTCHTARLVSARLVGSEVRDHDEVGVAVRGQADLLPVITELADRFAQDRFVVTDFTGRRTYAMKRRSRG